MKHLYLRRRLPGFSCLALCGAGLFVAGCRKPEVQALPPPVVVIETVEAVAVPMSTELIGRLDSPQTVEVRARVEALVDEMLFAEGTEVEQGAPLFKLDRATYLEKSAAALGALEEALAALHKAERDVERLIPLVQRGAVPQQDLDNAKAAVESGNAAVASGRARVESAQLELSYCEIKAPVAGLIGASQVAIGSLVGKGEPTLLATISTLDPIWFYCNVSEVDYLKAEERSRRAGRDVATLPVRLVLANGQEHPEGGKFVFIDRAVDSRTGTLRVRAEFPNPEKILRPGMFARVRVDLGTRENCVTVPERALVELQGKAFVWVLGEGKSASMRPVVTGELVNGRHLILEGLQAGETIIVDGIQKVRDGAPVTPVTAQQMAAMNQAGAAAAKP